MVTRAPKNPPPKAPHIADVLAVTDDDAPVIPQTTAAVGLSDAEKSRINLLIPVMVKQLADAGFDDRHGNAQIIARYLAGYKIGKASRGLLLWGDCGRGKSYACQVMSKILRCRFIHAQQLAEQWATDQDAFRESYLEPTIYTGTHGPYVDDLMIDDIGTELQQVSYGKKMDVIPLVIDAWDRLKSTAHPPAGRLFLTTNLKSAVVVKRYSERTKSRIDGLCWAVRFQGPDRRAERHDNELFDDRSKA